MNPTLIVILNAVCVVAGNIAFLCLGKVTAASASVAISASALVTIANIVHLKFAHSRAAQILDSTSGQAIEQLIEQKVATGLAPVLQRLDGISATSPVVAPIT
jgi:hypothetical protein